jgi:hypothetical protein
VGCDNTTKPLIAVRPRAVLLPDGLVTRGPFAWLSYTGYWGQREASFNNGPQGPITKTVWQEPLSWVGGTRTSSPIVPVGTILGPSVAHRFCGAVATVTSFINLAASTAPGAAALAIGILLIFLIPAALTTWRPVRLTPLGQRRALGQTLVVAARLQWRRRGTMTLLALSSVLIIGALDGLEYLVLHVVGAHHTGLSFTDSGTLLGSATSAGILQPLVIALTSAATIAVMHGANDGTPVGFLGAWGAVIHRLARIIAVQLLLTIALWALLLSIIGIPYAIKKLADWMFLQQQVLFEDRPVREAFHGSRDVARGHWRHAVLYAAVFLIIGEALGPLLSYAFLFTTIPALAVNVFGAVLFALLAQYAAIGRTLVYLDLKTRPAKATAPDTSAVAGLPAT